MRRSATVTISAPDAASARRVSSSSLYLPVPTMSRERQLLPASDKGVLDIQHGGSSSSRRVAWSATADEGYDLDLVAVDQCSARPRCAAERRPGCARPPRAPARRRAAPSSAATVLPSGNSTGLPLTSSFMRGSLADRDTNVSNAPASSHVCRMCDCERPSKIPLGLTVQPHESASRMSWHFDCLGDLDQREGTLMMPNASASRWFSTRSSWNATARCSRRRRSSAAARRGRDRRSRAPPAAPHPSRRDDHRRAGRAGRLDVRHRRRAA